MFFNLFQTINFYNFRFKVMNNYSQFKFNLEFFYNFYPLLYLNLIEAPIIKKN